jgi:uncharacterized delta-60 repeat protein
MLPLRLIFVALALGGFLVAAPAASAAPGDLDPSFGSGGSVRLLTTEEEASVKAVAVQPDDKVVIAGFENGNCVVVRLLPNGQPDPSFGSGGKVTTVFPGGESGAFAVTVQPDGKIVAAGAAEVAGNFDFFFARYLSGGALDPGFGGGDGIETVPVGTEEDEARSVAVGPGGRIVAVGEAEMPVNKTALGVVVLKADGTPDPSFGGNGSLVKQTAAGNDRGVAGALLGDGSVLLGDENAAGAGDGFTLMKLLPGGGYDPAFGGGDGIAVTPIPGAPGAGGRLRDFALRPDGRIVASGYGFDEVGSELDEKFAAVGYLPDGEPDPSFGENGVFSHQVAPGDEAADAVELTPNGKVLLAGFYNTKESYESMALLRLQPDGALDPGFGSGGQALRGPAAPFGDIFEEAALDAEERLVAVSTAYLGNNMTSVEVSRYLGDPRPPVAVPKSAPGSVIENQPAHAKMKPVPKKLPVGMLRGFFGTADDPDGSGVQKVQIAVVKKIRGVNLEGIRDSRPPPAARCFAMTNRKARLKRVKAHVGRCPQRWLKAQGTAKWAFKLKAQLPPGRYVVYARAVDGAGLAESRFSRKLGNRYAFRIVPPARGGPRLTTK